MPYNGSGTYTPPGADFPATPGTVISSTKYNNVVNDMATALSNCVTRDGQSPLTAALPLGGQALNAVALGSVASPSINATGAASTGIYWPSVTSWAVSISGTQRLRVDASGVAVTGSVDVADGGRYGFGAAGTRIEGSSTTNTITFLTNGGTTRGSVNSTGNWVVAAPTSGTAITATGSGVTGSGLDLTGTAGNGIRIRLAANGTTLGSAGFDLGIGFTSATDGVPYWLNRANTDILIATNGLERMRVLAAGGLQVAAPTSGAALVATGTTGGGVSLRLTDTSESYEFNRDSASGFLQLTGLQNTFSGYRIRVTRSSSVVTALEVSNAGGLTISSPGSGASLIFGQAASQIVPGATSISLRNNANSADNVLVADGGLVTLRGASGQALLVQNGSGAERFRVDGGGTYYFNSPSLGTAIIYLNENAAGGTSQAIISGGTTGATFGWNGTNTKSVTFDSSATNSFLLSGAFTATSATAGSRTLPSNPVDFLVVSINGTSRKIPYYAT